MKIGYTNPGYPVKRTILGKVQGCEYIRSRSLASVFSAIAIKLKLGRLASALINLFIGGTNYKKIALLHFFNVIQFPFCNKPFLTTFETALPRFPVHKGLLWKLGWRSLLSKKCKALLALSECSRRIQEQWTQEAVESGILSKVEAQEILSKIKVVHPPQEALIEEEELLKKDFSSPLKFLFVGKDFCRKGGGEIVRAFERVKKLFDVQLIVIGDPRRNGYTTDAQWDDADAILKLIQSNQDWITYYPLLENAKVLELMKACHVGLLPTRADTYGYSVLEMQACGLPVITTDVRALPEINNDECGWLIHVQKKACGEAFYATPEEIVALSQTIEAQLEVIVKEICKNPPTNQRKALAALKRIKEMHSPERYAAQLKCVYDEVLQQ